MRLILTLSMTLLAACGADGPPIAPSKATAEPAKGISGTVRIGVSGS